MGTGAAVDAGGEQLEDERVVLGRRAARRSMAMPGGTDGAGDVDALAAGLRGHRLGALHGAALERAGQRDRAVEAGVGGERDDHATTTSRPARRQRSAVGVGDAVVGDEDVDVVERRRTGAWARRRSCWRRRARRPGGRCATMARLTAASSRSGVDRPCVERERRWCRGRRRRRAGAASAATVSAPTAAWVVGRTRPGSRCSSMCGLPGEPGGDRHGVGDDGQARGRGGAGWRAGGRAAGVEQDRRRRRGAAGRAPRGRSAPSARCWPGRGRRARTR